MQEQEKDREEETLVPSVGGNVLHVGPDVPDDKVRGEEESPQEKGPLPQTDDPVGGGDQLDHNGQDGAWQKDGETVPIQTDPGQEGELDLIV